MNHLFLQSEDALYFYLKKFLKQQPKAVQLDGSPKRRESKKVLAVFEFSLNHKKYKLLGSLSRTAAEDFVRLVEEHGSPAMVLKESGDTLVLVTSSDPSGWKCEPYIEKASARLNDVA